MSSAWIAWLIVQPVAASLPDQEPTSTCWSNTPPEHTHTHKKKAYENVENCGLIQPSVPWNCFGALRKGLIVGQINL